MGLEFRVMKPYTSFVEAGESSLPATGLSVPCSFGGFDGQDALSKGFTIVVDC